MPNTTTEHSAITGNNLHEAFHYVQSSDPGAVGANKYWLDTSSNPYVLKRRNSGNSAWITVGSSGGSESDYNAAMSQAYDFMADTTSDPIDTLINVGDYYIFVYFSSQNTNSWKDATNAVHTVTAGKTLVVLDTKITSPNIQDRTFRRVRFWNSTDSLDIVVYTTIGLGFEWGGDVSDPTKFTTLAAGKTAKIQIWNNDATKRASGAIIICKEV